MVKDGERLMCGEYLVRRSLCLLLERCVVMVK
jgi:hypothetical protein